MMEDITPAETSIPDNTADEKKRTRKTNQEKLAELEAEEKALAEKKKALKSKMAADIRKERTKHLIEIGGAVYSVLGDSYMDGDIERLIAFLRTQDSRGEYFSKAMGRK